MLLNRGEQEDWVTAHCSTVRVVTPYGNRLTIMHEGASGGGKSEMLEQAHRESDGRLLLATHLTLPNEQRFLTLPRTCDVHPVTDDMARPDARERAFVEAEQLGNASEIEQFALMDGAVGLGDVEQAVEDVLQHG